jgi:hypothetical protein
VKSRVYNNDIKDKNRVLRYIIFFFFFFLRTLLSLFSFSFFGFVEVELSVDPV